MRRASDCGRCVTLNFCLECASLQCSHTDLCQQHLSIAKTKGMDSLMAFDGTSIVEPTDSLSTSIEDVEITDVQAVASYSWLDNIDPTILVPGTCCYFRYKDHLRLTSSR